MSEGVPEGWEDSYISDHFSLLIGGTPSRSNEIYWDNAKKTNNKWVAIRDLKGRYISKTAEQISDFGISKSNVKLIPQDTVIMSFKLSIGRLAITRSPMYTNEAIVAFIPKNTKLSDNKYLYYGLQSWNLLAEVDQAVKGATLNKEKMSRIFGLFPPLPVQKKIASILTSVDDVIETTQRQIDKLQDLKKATMNELLTKGIGHTEFKDSELGRIPKSWEVVLLGDLLELKNGVNTGKDAFGSGFPFLTYKDVHSGADLDENHFTTLVDLSPREQEAFSVRFGDIFFTRTSETPEEIGLTNTYLGEDVGAVFNGFCIRGRPKTSLLSPTLSKYLFRSEYIRSQMKFLCKYTTRAGISGESLNRCLIAVPTLSEQHTIENALIGIERNIGILRYKLTQTQALKKSLMQDLLTGKVRVQVH